MPTSTRLDDLLHRCEEARRRGEPVNPEELCRDCPELLEPVRRALAAVGDVDSLLGTLRPADGTVPAGPTPPALQNIPLQPGAEPVPDYRLTRRLGTGGFGEVWQVEGPGGFPLALKFVRLAGKMAAAELRGLEVVKRLRHPNLLATFAAWVGDEYLAIAMELADGTLADRLAEAQAQGLPGIPREELLGYMAETAKGIDYLNEPHDFAGEPGGVRVQHRDVKPANILLVGGGIKVADFGLSRVLAKTATGHSGALTPGYAPPEFFRKKTSQHSDQYSLAVAYCEMRGGRLPFVGTPAQVMLGHVMEAPDLGMLSDGERPAVARALAKKPEDRWPSCGAFVRALSDQPVRPTQSTRPAEQPGPAPNDPGRPVGRGRRAWQSALVGLALLSLAIGGLLWLSGGPAGTSQPSTGSPDRVGLGPGKAKPKRDVAGERRSGLADGERKAARDGAPDRPAPQQSRLVSFTGHTAPVRCIAWVPVKDLVLSGDDDGVVRLWNPETGEEVRTFRGHTGVVHCLAVSRDGRLALSGGDDPKIRLWDLDSGGSDDLALTVPNGFRGEVGQVYGVAFRGDDLQAVSVGNERFVRVWDIRTKRMAYWFDTADEEILSMAVTPDGRHLLTGGKAGKLRRWDLTTRQFTEYVGHRDDVMSIAVFPGGSRFISGGGGNGQRIGSQDYVVRVWDVDAARPVLDLPRHPARVVSVATSADGRRVVSASADGTILVWDVNPQGRAGPALPLVRDDGATVGVTCAALSADGGTVLIAHSDHVVRVRPMPQTDHGLQPPDGEEK